jgi:1-acyl-sn-glycerol-3-phosphate acyltransferase
MNIIRSILFNILFFAANIICCVGLLWIMVLPRRWAFKFLYYGYFGVIYQIEKFILGLDYEVIGREHIPTDGSYVIAMKHQSAYETLKMFHIFGDCRIILKRELTYLPLWGWYAAKIGMIAVDRGARGKAVQSIITNSKPVIDAGVPIMIYPQGTRVDMTDTIEDKPYKQGAIRLYENFDIPILPVAMNSGKFWPRNAFFKKSGTITFKILPIIPPGLKPQDAFKKMRDVIEIESQKLL